MELHPVHLNRVDCAKILVKIFLFVKFEVENFDKKHIIFLDLKSRILVSENSRVNFLDFKSRKNVFFLELNSRLGKMKKKRPGLHPVGRLSRCRPAPSTQLDYMYPR